ncbi:hypothetical protein KJ742_06420 [Patescibacteria group bacterium]|nr:hypothetical protein [Patescibacteria group bacterium]MBU1683546.1 hypothetical protein [Patescibacteria group bacterium]
MQKAKRHKGAAICRSEEPIFSKENRSHPLSEGMSSKLSETWRLGRRETFTPPPRPSGRETSRRGEKKRKHSANGGKPILKKGLAFPSLKPELKCQ